MKHLRMILSCVLALMGTTAIVAQPPPPSGLFPSPNPPIAVMPGDPMIVGPQGPPVVAIGETGSARVPKMWIDLGWGFYWASHSPMPSPLLTTSDPIDQGIIGAPSTAVLLGQAKTDYGTFNAVSLRMGRWWNEERTMGSESSNTWSEDRAVRVGLASDGTFPLFRPIYDAVLQGESSLRVAEDGILAGAFTQENIMDFYNGDSNLMFNISRNEQTSWTFLAGYRYFYLREQLTLIQDAFLLADGALSFLGQPLLAGDQLTITDRIETVNRLYVGQIGLRWERNFGRLNVMATGKFGLGWSNQRIYFDGRTTLEPAILTAAGGGVVQRSQPYRNQLEEFAVVPEVGFRATFQLIRRLHASFGYNFTYFSSVSRPGKYLDRSVELTQSPTSPTYTGVVGTYPQFREFDEGFYLHGINFGLTWQY